MAYPGTTRRPEAGIYQPPPPSPTSLFGNPSSFTAAANAQANDYDTIMAQYDDLAKSSITNPITAGTATTSKVQAPNPISAPSPVRYSNVAPQLSQYKQSGDVTSSLSGLSDLATTGGYSDADKADLRARGISPIRSIYANAQQNAERQRALSGGYSPNFGAVQTQLARDEASKIGDVTTNVNAGIAQNVASNRLSAAPAYASASSTANAAQTEADRHNADIVNQINELNAQGETQANEFNTQAATDANKFNTTTGIAVAEANANRASNTSQFNVQAALDAAKTNKSSTLGALSGKTSLYGTTPALTNTFGNQVMQAGQLDQNQQQLNNQKFNMYGGGTTRPFQG